MTAKDLKNALLQEAVQGKLVPQIPSEGNARELLEEIRKERVSHGLDFANAKSGKKKAAKEAALADSNPCDIPEDELPFDIPESWCWCRLGEIIAFIGGYAYDSHSFIENSDYQVLRLGNVKNGYLQLSAKPVYIDIELAEKTNAFKCITNDILVTMTGTRLKRDYFFTTLITENDKNLYVNQRVGCLRPTKFICANFLDWILKSKPILDYIFEFETGTANQGNLGAENIKTIPIPLPPLAEQKRIVAAIEKFMPLIEEYGKKEAELTELNAKISTLTKKAILQEAVQGKLVPQIKSEGNARELLEEIRKERMSHGLDFANAKSGKKKGAKEAALADSNPCDIPEDEIPFDIPESWCWCRLGDATLYTTDYIANGSFADTRENVKFYKTENYALLVKTQDFSNNFSYDLTYTDKHGYDFLKKSQLFGGELLLSNIGASIGKALIVPNLNRPMAVAPNSIIVKCLNSVITNYIKIVISSFYGQNILKGFTAGTAMPKFSKTQLRNCIIPLPPLKEMQRIVEAIEKLLPLCERLGDGN